MKRSTDSFSFAALLNLLLPGAGHIFWRDYLFGVFTFLIALLAACLVFFAFLVPLPLSVKIVLFSLPATFYLASFVDLYKTVQKKGRISKRGPRAAGIFLASAFVIQLAAPVAPGFMVLLNHPSISRVASNDLAPDLRRGDRVLCVAAAYRLKIPFLPQPVWYNTPRAGEMVSFTDFDEHPRIGLVIARAGEYAEIVDGDLWINGDVQTDVFPAQLRVSGDMPLTVAEPGSILVATLKLGALDQTYQVGGERLTGKVYRLF